MNDESTPRAGYAVHEVLIEHLTESVRDLTTEVKGLRADLRASETARLQLEGRVGQLETRRREHSSAEPREVRVPGWVWHTLTASVATAVTSLVHALAHH